MENHIDNHCEHTSHNGLKLIIPLLAIPLAFGLVRGVARHKFAHMHSEGWQGGVPPMFADLHRRAHAAETQPAAENPA